MGGDGEFNAIRAAKGDVTCSWLPPLNAVLLGQGLHGFNLPITCRIVSHLLKQFVTCPHASVILQVVLKVKRWLLSLTFAFPFIMRPFMLMSFIFPPIAF